MLRTLLVLCFLIPAVPARADDWLALHPECAFGQDASALGRMAILYPRPGLSAVVRAGEPLITRVRVPSGLTPPPGIQQDRALAGWSASLIGHSHRFDARSPHTHLLRVVDVRPDGPSSLVYRATVHVPAWAAPGTYALRMTAPGGVDAVSSAVRVLRADASPRVALLGRVEPSELAGLAEWPVDIWIAAERPALRDALERAPVPAAAPGAPSAPAMVLLPTGGLPVALRAGPEEAVVLGRCDGRFVRFRDRLEAILREEGRRAASLDHADLPSPSHWRRLDGDAGESLPDAPVSVVERTGDGFRLRGGPAGGELTLVFPDDGGGVTLEGLEPDWWPGTSVAAVQAVPSLALQVTLGAGEVARIRRGEGEPLDLSISAEPSEVETGLPVRLEAQPSRPARIAWQLAEDDTAVGPGVQHRWSPIGVHRVRALAISDDGVTARASRTVRVKTREVRGCGGCATPGGRPAFSSLLGLMGACVLLSFRRRRRNRAVVLDRWRS